MALKALEPYATHSSTLASSPCSGRYQEKVLSKGHEIINHYDKLLEKETNAGKRMALKTEANNAVADMVKKEAADTLDKVLFELCGQMKNAFARSDA